jgi:hypothetical protein
MDPLRTTARRRTTGRTLAACIVLAAALWGSLVVGGRLDAGASSEPLGSGSRHAFVHEHTAVLRALLPARNGEGVAKSSHRETFALAVTALAVALAYAVRRRRRSPSSTGFPSHVLSGAPRAPPSLHLPP